MNNKNRGVTLIELVVTVAIVGILFGIAYPSYRESVMKTRRSDARTEIQDYAQRLLRCRTTNTTYDTATGVCAAKDALDAGVVSRGGFYTITVGNLSATTFSVIAEPVANKSQTKDLSCKVFRVTEKGVKWSLGKVGSNNNAETTSTCWP